MNASSDRLLRRTLWGNAVFSVISGAVLAIFAGPFARAAAHAPVDGGGPRPFPRPRAAGPGRDRLRRALRLGRFAPDAAARPAPA